MVVDNKAIVRAMESALNRRDWTAYAASFADVIRWGRFPAQRDVSRSDYVATIQGIVQTFPDWRVEIERLIAEHDWVAERTKVFGTHLARAQSSHHGDLRGFEPTGKSVAVWQAHFWRVADGVIVEHEAVRDDLGLFRQLGVQ